MKKHHLRTILCAVVLVALSRTEGRAADAWWRERVQAGIRAGYVTLDDDFRGGDNTNLKRNFLGSIWGLNENQMFIPELFVQYTPWRYGGVGLTYSALSIETVDWSDPALGIKGTDGDLNCIGPALYALGRYPNDTPFTPFAELGWIYYFTEFDESKSWVGGTPGRYFDVDDTEAFFLTLGCDYRITEKWAAQVYYRLVREADAGAAAYFGAGYRPRPGEFPLDHDVFGLGVKYSL